MILRRSTREIRLINSHCATVHKIYGAKRLRAVLAFSALSTMSIPRVQAWNSTPRHYITEGPNDMKLTPTGHAEVFADSKSVSTKSSKNAILEIRKIAGKRASLYAKDFDKNAKLFQQMRDVDRLRWSDLEVGALLGKGTFNHVREVSLGGKGLRSQGPRAGQDCSEASLDTAEIFSESFDGHDVDIDESALSHTDKQFALKYIASQYLNAKVDFSDCAIDIVMEAKVLACLSHPNIIKLHAVRGGSLSRAFTRGRGYFLILDRVHVTLDARIRSWAENESSMSKVDRIAQLNGRLKSVVLGVVRGMKYLHKNKVIYRYVSFELNDGFMATAHSR